MTHEAALHCLLADRHSTLVLARRILLAVQGRGVDQRLVADEARRVFHEELRPRFDSKERCLLPLLSRAGENTLVERVLGEHRRLQELFERLPAPYALERIGSLLNAYVRFEEQELVEAARRCLGQGELQAVARCCATAAA